MFHHTSKDFDRLCKQLKKPITQICYDIVSYPSFDGYSKCLARNLSYLLYTVYLNRYLVTCPVSLKHLSGSLFFINLESGIPLPISVFEKYLVKVIKNREVPANEVKRCYDLYILVARRTSRMICDTRPDRTPLEEFERVVLEEVYRASGTKFDF